MSLYKQMIRNFLSELLDRNVKVGDNDSLLDAGLLDSLTMVQLLVFIEEQFKTTLDNDELIPENFETINAIASFLEQKGARCNDTHQSLWDKLA